MEGSENLQRENPVLSLDVSLLAALERSRLHAAAQEFLLLLDERTRRILGARFGVTGNPPKTLQEIGRSENITRERVRQLERSALVFLRDAERSVPSIAGAIRTALRSVFDTCGRVVREHTLMSALGLDATKDGAVVRFLLTALPYTTEARETQRTYAHWTIVVQADSSTRSEGKDSAVPSLEHVLELSEEILRRANKVLPDQEFLAEVSEAAGGALTMTALRSYLSTSKRIARTPFGEWGVSEWPEVHPRGVGDKAYVVLKRGGKPLHFTALTEVINASGFGGRQAHAQTVHNELIRDARFVLVGRGLYGLKAWGYEPGTVADVAVRLLAQAGRPMPKRDLVAAVLKERLVKRNTVLLALHNRRLFRSLEDGTYVLVARDLPNALSSTAESPPAQVGPP